MLAMEIDVCTAYSDSSNDDTRLGVRAHRKAAVYSHFCVVGRDLVKHERVGSTKNNYYASELPPKVGRFEN